MADGKRRSAGTGKRRERVSKKQLRAWGIIAGCILFAGASLTVYSKYYKTGFNKGMATASGFYFGSNYMTNAEIKGMQIEEIAASEDILGTITMSSNRTLWVGTNACHFDVQIRNYTNQLLFNDSELNLKYEVKFMLLDEPKGAGYSVKKGMSGDGSTYKKLERKGDVAVEEGILNGGSPAADSFDLQITLTDAAAYVPARILVVAYPTAPDFLADTKHMAGIITGNYEEQEFGIEEQGFTIKKRTDYTESNWKNVVAEESALTYQIRTTGNYTGTEQTVLRQKIKVKWKRDMLKINRNDKYYQTVKDDITKYYDDGEWQYMELEVMPYSSIKFVFFRMDTFEDRINSMTKEEFEASVLAEVVS